METRGKLTSIALVGAVLSLPLMAHSVTLGGAQKTPCLFGALGTRVQCATPKSMEKARLGVTPRSSVTSVAPTTVATPTETAPTVGPTVFSETTTPSERISETEETSEEEAAETDGENIETVPLPFGGVLLLSSLGLMLFANRKRA